MITTNGAAAPGPIRYPLPDLAASLVITWPILTTSGGAAAPTLAPLTTEYRDAIGMSVTFRWTSLTSSATWSH